LLLLVLFEKLRLSAGETAAFIVPGTPPVNQAENGVEGGEVTSGPEAGHVIWVLGNVCGAAADAKSATAEAVPQKRSRRRRDFNMFSSNIDSMRCDRSSAPDEPGFPRCPPI
jgi:hypothetical protein